MRPDQIKVGTVYAMRSGWYRRPIQIRMIEGVVKGVLSVDYATGRDPSNLTGTGHGGLHWFAANVISEVELETVSEIGARATF